MEKPAQAKHSIEPLIARRWSPRAFEERPVEPEKLKKEFGKDLTFYGSIDTQKILSFGSVQDIKNEVLKMTEIFGQGGKFILVSSHFLMDDVPLENVLALYNEK